jgi:hypothetical protein
MERSEIRDSIRMATRPRIALRSMRATKLWEVVIHDMGAESDFTSAIKPIEAAAGVVVGGTNS